jgi:calcineurin-like phosphoesterase family protein
MPSVFLTADTHFSHWGVCKFLSQDGQTKLRPWDNPNDMDEAMVALWNDTVKPNDKVYHLGDAVINRRGLKVLGLLHGDKVLIKGNHDIFKLDDYIPYFRDIRAYHVMDKFLLSHIPVHESQKRRWEGNIHGHLHDRSIDDPWYTCVSVEHTGFKPILFEELTHKIRTKPNQNVSEV